MVKKAASWRLDPSKCALLIIDVQNHFAHQEGRAYQKSSACIVPNILRITELWKKLNGLVIYTRHCHKGKDDLGMFEKFYDDYIRYGEWDSEIISVLSVTNDFKAANDNIIIEKNTYDAFWNTDLNNILTKNKIEQVLITGGITHLCCETTARAAFVRGFQVFFGTDLTFTKNEELQKATLRAVEDGFGKIVTSNDILELDNLKQHDLKQNNLKQNNVKQYNLEMKKKVLTDIELQDVKEVVVIGAGPGGASAAIQLKRLGITPYLIEKNNEAGGFIENANSVENYIGVEKGIKGTVLAESLRNRLDQLNIKVNKLEIKEIKKREDFYELISDAETIYAYNVIIAVGTEPIKTDEITGFPQERIFYDLMSIKRSGLLDQIKNILIVGGGEAAFDYSLSLTEIGKKIIVVIRSSESKAGGMLKKKVEEDENINIFYNTTASDVLGRYKDINAVLIAIGRDSALRNIKSEFDLKRAPNIYVIGDAEAGKLGQFGIAVGNGLACAGVIAKKIEEGKKN